MGNRATCPVCEAYSSDVLSDIENGKDCRNCECPNGYLVEYQEIIERQEIYKKNKCSEYLLEQNQILVKENFILKTKIEKLIKIFGYDFDCPLIDSIQQVLKIIHNDKD